MELVALLSTGQGTWSQISGLINHGDWEKIIILGEHGYFQQKVKDFGEKKAFSYPRQVNDTRLYH